MLIGVSAATLTSAENFATSYADSIGAATLTSADNYADTVGANTLSSAQQLYRRFGSGNAHRGANLCQQSRQQHSRRGDSYTDTATAATLTSAKSYADGVGVATLASANGYTDAASATTLSAAQLYADGVGTSTLNSANIYTDTATAATLTSAKTYADGVGAATLTSANSYTDASSAATLASANNYTDLSSATTLRSANAYTDAMGVTVINAANNYTDTRTQFFAASSSLAPAQASGLESLSLGRRFGRVRPTIAVFLGSNAQATADNAFAGGYGATVLATGGVALGQGSSVTAANSAAIGTSSIAQRGAQIAYIDPLSSQTTSSVGEVSGWQRRRGAADHQCRGWLGGHRRGQCSARLRVPKWSPSASQRVTPTILRTRSSRCSTSYGYNTSTNNGPGSVAVGTGASATGQNSAAVGAGSSAAADNSVALGAGSQANRGAQSNYKDPISGKTASSVGEVSVGSPGGRAADHQRRAGHRTPPMPPMSRRYRPRLAKQTAYTNTLFGKAARQTWSVAAVSQALANMPQAPAPGLSMVGMGLGFSHGEVGMAVGGSYYMPDNSVIMKASASYGGQAGLSAGLGWFRAELR